MLASWANYQVSLHNSWTETSIFAGVPSSKSLMNCPPQGTPFTPLSKTRAECDCHGEVQRWAKCPASTAWDPPA